MIDLHTHTIFSDGVLVPSELVYRAKVKGYRVIALTDHVDSSNIDIVAPRIVKVSQELTENYGITVLPGVELTCVPPNMIKELKDVAKKMGVKIVLVHGEAQPDAVPEGTNMEAILAEVDVIAHPGLIRPTEMKLAAERGVYVEITTKKIYLESNTHVAKLANDFNARLILNSDTHIPEDLLTPEIIEEVLLKAGLKYEIYAKLQSNAENLLRRCLK